MTHGLKVWPEYMDGLLNKSKTFEVRKNDRDFKVGDVLTLSEWDNVTETWTGRTCTRYVTYVLQGGQFGIAEDTVVLGIH